MVDLRMVLAIAKDLLGPQKSDYAVRDGNYRFSYRKRLLGPLQYFTVSATSQAEADMKAARTMRTLTENLGALKGSLRRA